MGKLEGEYEQVSLGRSSVGLKSLYYAHHLHHWAVNDSYHGNNHEANGKITRESSHRELHQSKNNGPETLDELSGEHKRHDVNAT